MDSFGYWILSKGNWGSIQQRKGGSRIVECLIWTPGNVSRNSLLREQHRLQLFRRRCSPNRPGCKSQGEKWILEVYRLMQCALYSLFYIDRCITLVNSELQFCNRPSAGVEWWRDSALFTFEIESRARKTLKIGRGAHFQILGSFTFQIRWLLLYRKFW